MSDPRTSVRTDRAPEPITIELNPREQRLYDRLRTQVVEKRTGESSGFRDGIIVSVINKSSGFHNAFLVSVMVPPVFVMSRPAFVMDRVVSVMNRQVFMMKRTRPRINCSKHDYSRCGLLMGLCVSDSQVLAQKV